MGRPMSLQNQAKKVIALQLYQYGLTQVAISKELDVSRNAVKEWVRGVNDNRGHDRDGCEYYTLAELETLFKMERRYSGATAGS